MPGNGKIILKSGNAGDLTIVQGTVEVQAGATLKHVDDQGGTFELEWRCNFKWYSAERSCKVF